jgi:hypothetical protein
VKLWRPLGKGAWVLAGIASIALWVLVLIADALSFVVSYAQPFGSYTGQEWDRAMSWVLLGILVAASALVIAVVRLPARYRHVLASARSGDQSVKEWLACQQPWRLTRLLMGFNGPITIAAAVVPMLVAIASSFRHAPAGALLWAAAAGMITAALITAVEFFLIRRGQRQPHARVRSPV